MHDVLLKVHTIGRLISRETILYRSTLQLLNDTFYRFCKRPGYEGVVTKAQESDNSDIYKEDSIRLKMRQKRKWSMPRTLSTYSLIDETEFSQVGHSDINNGFLDIDITRFLGLLS